MRINREIVNLEIQCGYFWKAKTCSYLAKLKYLKTKLRY